MNAREELNTLKEIEQAHKIDNGLLRQELVMQIEHNKELEATLYNLQRENEILYDEKENLEFEIEELKGQIYDLGGEIE